MGLEIDVNAKELRVRSFHQYSHETITANNGNLDQPPLRRTLLIVEERALERECLSCSISTHKKAMDVFSFPSIAEWESERVKFPVPNAILVSIGTRSMAASTLATEIRTLCSRIDIPIVLLADTDELPHISKALECGVKGYIPSSVSLDVCVEAISLSMVGGIFVPVGSLHSMRKSITKPVLHPMSGFFTDRQLDVVEALRRGKANKIIAFELKMQESTVKVHVRNIMKKVNASNRTEVAYKIMELVPTVV